MFAAGDLRWRHIVGCTRENWSKGNCVGKRSDEKNPRLGGSAGSQGEGGSSDRSVSKPQRGTRAQQVVNNLKTVPIVINHRITSLAPKIWENSASSVARKLGPIQKAFTDGYEKAQAGACFCTKLGADRKKRRG